MRELQRLAFAVIRTPLTPGGQTRAAFHDGRPMQEVVGQFIKPNDRLTSLERLAIYNRQYWYRLMDCLYDDYPGLRALLGKRKFEKLRIAYLDRYPSASFTLRDLGSRLERFLIEEPQYTAPLNDICLDMARFEWAQIVAFDSAMEPVLAVDDLLGQNPDTLRLRLQPYLTVLEMGYPLDDFVLAVKKRDMALRTEASNAIETNEVEKSPPAARRPKPATTFLAVHRHENQLYYKRLEALEYRILTALRDGSTLSQACATAIELDDADEPQWMAHIGRWFKVWAEMGWFCKKSRDPGKGLAPSRLSPVERDGVKGRA